MLKHKKEQTQCSVITHIIIFLFSPSLFLLSFSPLFLLFLWSSFSFSFVFLSLPVSFPLLLFTLFRLFGCCSCSTYALLSVIPTMRFHHFSLINGRLIANGSLLDNEIMFSNMLLGKQKYLKPMICKGNKYSIVLKKKIVRNLPPHHLQLFFLYSFLLHQLSWISMEENS